MQNSFIVRSLTELRSVIQNISREDYILPLESVGNSSIGEHVRHVINMFQCLEEGVESGVVNYDKRRRDKNLEENPKFACEAITEVIHNIRSSDFSMELTSNHMIPDTIMKTCYQRELIYCSEHCIHHQALIKVALKELRLDALAGPEFGVAPSTIAFKNHVHS